MLLLFAPDVVCILVLTKSNGYPIMVPVTPAARPPIDSFRIHTIVSLFLPRNILRVFVDLDDY